MTNIFMIPALQPMGLMCRESKRADWSVQQHEKEMLTIVEFAERLKIGRSTLFGWVKKGVLISGKHYIKIERVLRFIWSDDIIASLSEAVPLKKQNAKQIHEKSTKPGVNWDY